MRQIKDSEFTVIVCNCLNSFVVTMGFLRAHPSQTVIVCPGPCGSGIKCGRKYCAGKILKAIESGIATFTDAEPLEQITFEKSANNQTQQFVR